MSAVATFFGSFASSASGISTAGAAAGAGVAAVVGAAVGGVRGRGGGRVSARVGGRDLLGDPLGLLDGLAVGGLSSALGRGLGLGGDGLRLEDREPGSKEHDGADEENAHGHGDLAHSQKIGTSMPKVESHGVLTGVGAPVRERGHVQSRRLLDMS